jgi:hypothetical protein
MWNLWDGREPNVDFLAGVAPASSYFQNSPSVFVDPFIAQPCATTLGNGRPSAVAKNEAYDHAYQ